jgi:hypothetical protein
MRTHRVRSGVKLLRRVLVVLILAGSALAFTAARPAWACSCGDNPDPLESAEAAFTGIATDVDRPWSTGGTVTVTFEVESMAKGEVGRQAELTTSSQGPACGYEFVEGHRYRVYARDGATNSCDGNADLGFVRAPRSATRTVEWSVAGAVVIAAAAAAGYLWFRRHRRIGR